MHKMLVSASIVNGVHLICLFYGAQDCLYLRESVMGGSTVLE